ncbi:T9SS type A sorting domain-containing protein [Aequorivita echinoideorum]|uniref:T9SS type A sorting domain-containing protein n=1 Tax=Aequorivita echinoideorum TaxID=1549647 RepID=A0ABS5SB52_9FLAO|nr:T9SS type A sorting domain-containing protein [Aequorivita echinoideorum]MBT0609100.1 T9SS type A sorting domain-containing protein [Aequorivita echinoideorum]
MRRFLLLIFLFNVSLCFSQSIARAWNEEVLNGIRNDYARPTVHARNLFHTSVVMYDMWAVFDDRAETYFLGKNIHGFNCAFDGFTTEIPKSEAQNIAISYAVYRLIQHRFANSPEKSIIMNSIDNLMDTLGYDKNYSDTNYNNGNPAALGNYMALKMIEYGLQDGSNEENGYVNQFYEPKNEPLNLDLSGNVTMTDPNHWQPLKIEAYVDQSGHTIPGGQPPFLSPEWGRVSPFSLTEEDKTVQQVPGYDFWVYHDPGPPSFIEEGMGIDDFYKWNFSLVAAWGAHHDPSDGVLMDISPKSLGNLPMSQFPETFEQYKHFYDLENGGDPSRGRNLNPVTGEAYEPQIVHRGDYTRALAEFWADGPDSETPPGHWFAILNYVNDHPQTIKKIKGKGPIVSDLEWDVKGYFILGGTMHDIAITAWGIKGFYDFVRPISAIRYMGDRGQSSDPNEISYNPRGLPLIPGRVEVVKSGDSLAGAFNENVGKMKLFTWRGPDYIVDPLIDEAGVGWILAEEWWPYQRPSFVTPPFAGYISGHSTFSRAAAQVLTMLTGTEYFPGGMGVFDISKNEFLVFEEGPTQDFQLQWATYFDASDQCSLSRIWGGIHPPIDDIPGRKIGNEVGIEAFEFAENYFSGKIAEEGILFPNPAGDEVTILYRAKEPLTLSIFDVSGRLILKKNADFNANSSMTLDVSQLVEGIYFVDLFAGRGKIWTAKMIKK